MNVDLLEQELCGFEGLRLSVYDDATGEAIKPGTTVKGHPTVGIGRALDVRGITQEEAEYLLRNDVVAVEAGLSQRFTWWGGLDDVRQRVLANMAFQMGINGVTGFVGMIAAIERQAWTEAAQHMRESAWAKQTPKRAAKLADAMESGTM